MSFKCYHNEPIIAAAYNRIPFNWIRNRPVDAFNRVANGATFIAAATKKKWSEKKEKILWTLMLFGIEWTSLYANINWVHQNRITYIFFVRNRFCIGAQYIPSEKFGHHQRLLDAFFPLLIFTIHICNWERFSIRRPCKAWLRIAHTYNLRLIIIRLMLLI